MTTYPRRRSNRPVSWVAGFLVLGGLAWTIMTLVEAQRRRHVAAAIPEVPVVERPVSAAPGAAGNTPSSAVPVVRTLEGVVLLPRADAAANARVEVFRVLTEGPEWQRESLGFAITGPDGAFKFDLPQRFGLLVGYTHPEHAGDLIAVPARRDDLVLKLQPGFDLTGVVTSEAGNALGGVRVAVESTIDQRRRVEVQDTNPFGRYRFTNLRAGQVRLVARHPRWQAVSTTIRIGETRQQNIAFGTAASAPLRGQVVTPGQVPIAGAKVELVPTNSRLGHVDPITAATDADGRFELPGSSRGTMSLLVRHPEHGVLRRSVSVGTASSELVFELPPRAGVHGALQLETEGLGLAAVTLRVIDAAGQLHFTATNDDGEFQFDGVSPGRAHLALMDRTLAFARSQSYEMTVYVEERQQTELQLPVVEPSVVRGRCVDPDGRPLAGVDVRGSVQVTAAKLIGSNLASYIGSVGNELALTLGSESPELLAVSAADGTFEVAAQEPGPLLLRFELAGRARRQQRVIVPSPAEPEQLEDVVMMRGCRIKGTVRRGTRPIAGVLVSVVGSESQAEVVTGANGRFAAADLMPGVYRVRARQPSMAVGLTQQQVEVALGREAPSVELVLPKGRAFRGLIVSPGGKPVANARVSVRGAGTQPTLTDADGSFSIELPERRIQLQISSVDGTRVLMHTVAVGKHEDTIRFDVPPTCTLVADVVGLPGRKRVPAVLLRLTTEGGVPARPRWVEVQNGKLRWPSCPIGRCTIEIRCEGYAPFRVVRDLAADESHDLGEVLLERGARLHGIVVDQNGKPVANASVFLGDEADLDVFDPNVRSAVDGTFTLHGVSTRSQTVVAHAPGFAAVMRELRLPDDVLGRDPIQLAMQPGATITVQVANAPDAGVVQLWRDGRQLAGAALDDAGRAEFFDRRPGTYEVRLYGSETPPRTVTVAGPGEPVTVTLQ